MDNQIKIEDWEIQFDKFTDYYKCTPQFKSYIRTLLKSQRESRDKELREKVNGVNTYYKGEEDDFNRGATAIKQDILSLLKEDK